MMGYHCKECKAPVNQTDTGLVRTCEHTGTIIVGMSATCYGEGDATGDTGIGGLKALFFRIWAKVFGG